MEISYVKDHTIFETIVGSQAYGLNTPESDIDIRGVMIPGKEFFLGLKKFEQFTGFPGEDRTTYDFRKALRLMGDGNPNMLDLLFVPDRCVQITTPYWERIRENRHLFVSLKCKFTFSGYAISQLNRIRTHRDYILNPPKKKPERSEYGLPEESIFPTAQIKSLVASVLGDFFMEDSKENFLDELDGIYGDYIMPLFYKYVKEDCRHVAMEWLQITLKAQCSAIKAIGPKYIKDEYLDMAEKELQYYSAKHNWDRYQQWFKTRNKKRIELELKYGFDTKHASHLVRLIRMCKEILTTGKVNVERTGIDADELRAIKNGAWSYEQVEQYAENMDESLDALYKTSTLQKCCKINAIDDLCVEVCEEYLFRR
jgi:predicted nucleotidyltransferase